MNRKTFLRTLTAGVAVPSLLNGFGVKAYTANPLSGLTDTINTDTDHVVVLINLAGGNDGLNTIIPIDQYDALHRARLQVSLPEKSLLPITGNNTLAFHPAMLGLQTMYNEGLVRIVQNIGYPEPNLSHFRSSDIWMSGSDSNQFIASGWAGRYLNYEYPNFPVAYPNENMPHPLAMEIGYSQSLALMGPQTNMGYVIADIDWFYKLVAGKTGSIPNTPAGEQLAYIRLISQQSRAYSQAIVNAAARVKQQRSYPDTELAAKLKIVARLIAGGLKTRLYMVTLEGFDTHDSQVDKENHTLGNHANLLQMLSGAIISFMRDIKELGIANRVVGMTFSEFGRRVVSNSSIGTDHGAAAPLFLFGHPVAGGVLGKNPVIPRFVPEEYSIPMEFDFRSVYATVLKDWLCVPAQDIPSILQREFPYLDLFHKNLPCISSSIAQDNKEAGISLLSIAPNPVQDICTIKYETQGGQVLVHLLDAAGRIVATPANANLPKGQYDVIWNVESLPNGLYYCRLMNGNSIQTKNLIKIGT